jgi:outer membrane receptor protein involved in Fe transport
VPHTEQESALITAFRSARANAGVARAVKLILAGAFAATAAAAVQAQEAAVSAAATAVSEEQVVELEEIVVTGTSIRREDDAALPVTVVSAEDMELRDAGSPVDLLTSLPAVSNVPTNESTQGGAGARGDIANVALRGLGSGSTLLLLNGRRMAAHGISANESGVPSNSVNANVMPSRGLSRVDILRDGASSIYGSDAVAGVVNFIVDTTFEGTEIELQAGKNEIDSGDDRRATITHGGFYFGDRLHWTTTFDAYDRDPTKSLDIMGDSNKTALAPAGFNALTGAFFDRNASSKYPSFRVGTATATRYLVPTATGAAFSTTVPARDGQFSSQYYFDVNNGYSLPESTRYNWFNQLDYKLSENVSLFGEALLYKATSTMVRDPIVYTSSADRAIVLAASNPFNPFGSRYYSPTGAANTDGSPRLTGTPQSVTIASYRFEDNGPETVDVDTDADRFVFGARGLFGEGWSWESAVTRSRATTKDTSLNGIRESSMLAAIAAGQYNPFGYNFAVQGTAVVPTTPYVNDAGVREGFTQHFVQNGRNYLTSVDARVSGPVLDTWAGSIQVAAGGEYRWDDYELHRPQYAGLNYPGNALGLDPANNDFVRASPAGNIDGERKVYAGFAETVIPLASPANDIPLMHSLNVGASVRYEHYDDFGSTTNPKFTLEYRPLKPVMIRGSYNEGFRAPTLAAINYPSRTAVSSYDDPYRLLLGSFATPQDGSFSRLATTSGNPNLSPELSKGYTLGVVLDVPYVDGLRVSVDWFKIEQQDIIAAPNSTQVRNNDRALLQAATAAALAAGTPLASIDLGSGTANYQGNGLVRRAVVTQTDRDLFAAYNAANPGTPLATVGAIIDTSAPFSNLDSAEIQGFDYNLTYTTSTYDWGKLGFSTDWAYIKKFERVGGYTGDVGVQVGIDGVPELRGSAGLNWSRADWSAGVSAYYIGSYASSQATISATNYAALADKSYVKQVNGIYYWRVDDSVTLNAFVQKTFSSDNGWLDGIGVRLGVRNLTDKKPPLSPDNGGFDPSVYNSVAAGRGWTLRLSKSF